MHAHDLAPDKLGFIQSTARIPIEAVRGAREAYRVYKEQAAHLLAETDQQGSPFFDEAMSLAVKIRLGTLRTELLELVEEFADELANESGTSDG